MAAGIERGELVQKALAEVQDAIDREEKALDLIRAELLARAGDHPGGPIPRSRLGMEASLAKQSLPLRPREPPAPAS
ncbi:MAG TPA: hypothetical protein VMA32_06655 [Streptosporangiaceae bacterium]|nr:hypothetical protein [Streptosporangiaceae bacterium]